MCVLLFFMFLLLFSFLFCFFFTFFNRMSVLWQLWLYLNVGIHEFFTKILSIVIESLKPDKTDYFYFPIKVHVCLLHHVLSKHLLKNFYWEEEILAVSPWSSLEWSIPLTHLVPGISSKYKGHTLHTYTGCRVLARNNEVGCWAITAGHWDYLCFSTASSR